MAAHMRSSRGEIDKETLQMSYDMHLARIQLLEPRYSLDTRTKLPQFDSRTGAQKVSGYELTRLGRLLLRQLGISENGCNREHR